MERRINIKNRDRVVKSSSGLELSKISSNWFFKLVALAISIALFYSVFNSAKITIQKLEILRKAEQEVEDLRLTNLHLSISIKDMSTDRYLEKEARDRLNFGGEGEVVFVIPENSLELAKGRVEEILKPEEGEVYEQSSNISEWVDFILSGV
ncbi:MAG TPA: septum formation initiator family protein [Candidatus Dojkabacteria bacterium]|nr:septum formation initiator family protein [Candidatus Dojkabacteria bacterium]